MGIIDEGIQYNHKDLKGQVWTNPYDTKDGADNDKNGYKDDIHGWDFYNKDKTIYDGGKKGISDDHGTHVAGTIGAIGEMGRVLLALIGRSPLFPPSFLDPAAAHFLTPSRPLITSPILRRAIS